ncbi:MAG: DUF4956 domain-containing protein [Lachnospiraceae bacterium]
MSKEEILSYFYTNSTEYGVKRTLIILLCGLAVGLIIYLTYYISSEKIAYNRKFNWSLVIMHLITVIVMMMISSNIAVSLGMVGALSIVRFRTAVKDSRDTMFIFWAMAEGLCVSSQNWRMTFTTVLFIAAVLIISSGVPGVRNKYLLVVNGEGKPIDRKLFEDKLKPYVVGFRVRTANKDADHEEMICEIRTKGEVNLDVLDALLSVPGVASVNWVAQSGETVG